MTFIGTLCHDGVVAPWVIDDPISGKGFRTHVEQVLVPEPRTGAIVVMDSLGSHQAPAVRQAIRAAGARPFHLPARSPDLNPVEQVIAKLKQLLRKAAVRTKKAVCRRIGSLLDPFAQMGRDHHIRNAGRFTVWTGGPAPPICGHAGSRWTRETFTRTPVNGRMIHQRTNRLSYDCSWTRRGHRTSRWKLPRTWFGASHGGMEG